MDLNWVPSVPPPSPLFSSLEPCATPSHLPVIAFIGDVPIAVVLRGVVDCWFILLL